MGQLDVNPSALIDALLEALEHNTANDGYMTSVEITGATGWCNKRVRDRLLLLKQSGRLEVGIVERENIAGRMARIPGYRIKRGDGQDA